MSNATFVSPMEQLIGFVEWERKHNPGKKHVAEWALAEIERLHALAAPPAGEQPTACPHGVPHRWPCERCDAPAPSLQPLTRVQVDAIFDANQEAPTMEFRYLVTSAIERAHGITE